MKSNGESPSIALPLLALSSFFFSLATSNPRTTEAGLLCSASVAGNVAGNVIPNFVTITREILNNVNNQRWGNYSLTSPPPAVYGLAQCLGDLTQTDCHLCLAESRNRIPQCLPNFGRIYLDGCFLCCDGYDFFNETLDPTHDMLNCSSNSAVPGDQKERVAKFSDRVDGVLRNVLKSAVLNKGFAVAGEEGAGGGVAGVYALAQCWSTLDAGSCRVCLENATSKARSCATREEARAMNAGCFLRYSTTKFYSVPVSGGSSRVGMTIAITLSTGAATLLVLIGACIGYKKYKKKQGSSRVGMTIAIASSAGAATLLVLIGACIGYKKYKKKQGSSKVGMTIAIASSASATTLLVLIGAYIGYKKYKKKQVHNSLMQLLATESKFRLYFKYEKLEKATNFFHESRKLGQGGGGSVYKGILPNGKVVAVKRLVFNMQQWVDDLFNEVTLINGIQHKNLVRLLGCSIEGPESLLVYEYVPNKSLDQVLFVDNATCVLTWEERLHIIIGIAKGLVYLHGGSGVKIIHRDIKASNILLDENLTAKIADFGLVRCIAPDKSHLSTRIAGTLGYMAPEYLVRGQLTEKADVYAFGVVVLEILRGRKNSIHTQGSSSVLQLVWKHYKSNNLAACIDPALRGEFPVLEASNVIQIGLLCTQASMVLRPSMSEVVEMLHDKDCVVPQPKQPPFLNASVLYDKSSNRSNTCTHSCPTSS